MKKLISLFLAVSCAVSLTACGNGRTSEPEAAASVQAEEEENMDTEKAVSAAVYVSEKGDDLADGSQNAPYRTIDRGLADIASGQAAALYVLDGTYEAFSLTPEHSGTAEAPVLIAAYEGAQVRIEAPDAEAGIWMIDVDHITVSGFDVSMARYGISYESTAEQGEVPLEDVTISKNTVHDIVGTHGISVYARNYRAPMKNVVVENNSVYNCRCDSSESMVLNGNIDGFTIRGNVIHDNNNIGIDMIGFEGTAKKPEGSDPYEVDFVRNGSCYGNVVYNISSFNNQAYWTTREDGGEWYDEYAASNPDDPSLVEEGFYDLCADGIYVDGGQNIEVYENFIYNCDIGIEIATEHSPEKDPRFQVSGMNVHDNVIASCMGWAGICLGGYDSDLGFTRDCVFRNNTLYNNGAGFALQRSCENLIEKNLVVGGSLALDINDLGNDGEDYVNDNVFGSNCWVNTEEEEDFFAALEEIGDSEQSALQKREEEGGFGSTFIPAQEYVDGYLALTDEATEETMEQAALVLTAAREKGIYAEELAEYDGDLLACLYARLAEEGIENVKLEMLPSPVNDPDQRILCSKGDEECYTRFQQDGRIDTEKETAPGEELTVKVSVCIRCEYAPDSYTNARISGIPVIFGAQ